MKIDIKYQNQEFFDKIPEPELVIENEAIFLKRPWIQSYLASNEIEDVKYLKHKRFMTQEERARRLEKLRIMEVERKKALKATAKRAKLKRLGILEEEKKDTVIKNIMFILN